MILGPLSDEVGTAVQLMKNDILTLYEYLCHTKTNSQCHKQQNDSANTSVNRYFKLFSHELLL